MKIEIDLPKQELTLRDGTRVLKTMSSPRTSNDINWRQLLRVSKYPTE